MTNLCFSKGVALDMDDRFQNLHVMVVGCSGSWYWFDNVVFNEVFDLFLLGNLDGFLVFLG